MGGVEIQGKFGNVLGRPSSSVYIKINLNILSCLKLLRLDRGTLLTLLR
jgi:hypothetical protein